MIYEMKQTIRVFFMLMAFLVVAATESWALDLTDVIIPTPEHGSITATSVEEITAEGENKGSWTVTITVKPEEGYYIKKQDIIVQKLVATELVAARAARRASVVPVADPLPLDGPEASNTEATYTFVIPKEFAGALVTATFTTRTSASAVIKAKTLTYNDAEQALVDIVSIVGASFDSGTILAEDAPLSGYYTKSDDVYTACKAEDKADGITTYYQPTTPPISFSVDDGSYTTAIPTKTDAGNYTVHYKVVPDAAHSEGSGDVEVTILQATITEVTLTNPVLQKKEGSQIFTISAVKAGELDVPTTGYTTSGDDLTQSDEREYKLTVTGIGNFKGTVTTYFRIIDATIIDSGTTLPDNPDMDGTYILASDISASKLEKLWNTDTNKPFTGVLDGNYYTIDCSGYGHALFNKLDGGKVKNVTLINVGVSSADSNGDAYADGDAGAIANVATGASRIYNCGILPDEAVRSTDGNITGFTGSSVSGTRNVGALVGLLDGSARVINCYSYANVSVTGSDENRCVGGIVGYNNVATNANSKDTEHYLKTMVMNCMFYGDLTGDNKAPIYNGENIVNKDDNGVGNYNYFWSGASYVQDRDIDTYNCALAAETF